MITKQMLTTSRKDKPNKEISRCTCGDSEWWITIVYRRSDPDTAPMTQSCNLCRSGYRSRMRSTPFFELGNWISVTNVSSRRTSHRSPSQRSTLSTGLWAISASSHCPAWKIQPVRHVLAILCIHETKQLKSWSQNNDDMNDYLTVLSETTQSAKKERKKKRISTLHQQKKNKHNNCCGGKCHD